MRLEQICYGRDSDGYGIKGASLPYGNLTDRAANLCQSIGTPGFSAEEDEKCPFLFQSVAGDYILMACGRTGEPDDLGRGTLFFHIFAARLSEVKSAGVTAETLYHAGLFVDKCMKGNLQPVEFDPDVIAERGTGCLEFPAVVLCRRADNMKVLELLGSKAVGTSWSTMSWCRRKNCDAYGLSDSYGISSLPDDVNVYDVEGRILRRAVRDDRPPASSQKMEPAPRKPVSGRRISPIAGTGILCLLMGAAAGYLGGVALMEEKRTEPKSESVDAVEHRIRNELSEKFKLESQEKERSAKEEISALLAKVKALEAEKSSVADAGKAIFDEKYRIERFADRMLLLPQYKNAMRYHSMEKFRELYQLFSSLREYVEFVNKHYPAKRKENLR